MPYFITKFKTKSWNKNTKILFSKVMIRKILRYGFCKNINEQTKKMYILSQFPYPSGDLHLGHARVYYIGDSLSAYYRLKNYKVIYPIGWDSFGLPAENAAIVHGKNPKQWTQSNIEKMKQQLRHLKINFNWEMELSTCTPQYYKWTQQIFIKMFKKGLAYKKMAEVNWDPIDQTVLANEQVDENGCSWRSGAKVQKKMLNQWFLKITEYSQQLVAGLENLNWIEKVKNMQKGWIGLKKGYTIKFQLAVASQQNKSIQVFVENLQALQTAKFIIRRSQNLEFQQNSSKKDQIISKVINPQDGSQLIVIQCPKQESISFSVVSEKDLKMNDHYKNIFNKYVKSQNKQNQKTNEPSQKFAIENIFKQQNKFQQLKLKDWLISRQRFWGCPIPIVNCKNCGSVPVKEQDLPVLLPEWKNDGNPLLKPQFKKCKCPKCGSQEAERQTDTMDTFVDSSWYFLRFMDNLNKTKIFQNKKVEEMMPVDVYIGGIQHAIMHLLYARFVMRFIQKEYQLNQNCIQPFKELVVQGLVKGKTYSLKQNGRYVSLKDVQNGKYSIDDIKITYEKMSKSKFNGLNPNILVDKFGSDALRTAIFFANPPDRDIDFSEEIVSNAQKFLKRVQNLWKELSLLKTENFKQAQSSNQDLLPKEQLLKLRNIFQKMQISIQKRLMHTYVANVMEMFNLIKQFVEINNPIIKSQKKVKIFAIFVRVLSIIAPQLSKCLQKNLLTKFSILLKQKDFEKWPSDQLFGERVEVLIMKGKKMVSKDTVDLSLSDDEIIRTLKINGKVQEIKRQKKKFIIILE